MEGTWCLNDYVKHHLSANTVDYDLSEKNFFIILSQWELGICTEVSLLKYSNLICYELIRKYSGFTLNPGSKHLLLKV